MNLAPRKLVTSHGPNRAPIINFVTYIHPTLPILQRRTGWEVADDLHDDMVDRISTDNGATWGEPRPFVRRVPVEGGYRFVQEGGAVYIPERDLLVSVMYQVFQPSLGGFTLNQPMQMRIIAAKPADHPGATPFVSDFGVAQGVALSFSHPFVDSRGRVLVPVMWNEREADPEGPLHRAGIPFQKDHPDVAVDYCVSALLIGEFNADGSLRWRLGGAVPQEPTGSSRGLCEGAVIETTDGRLAMVLRGSNHLWEDRPGYKWLTLSGDGGETWSRATPFACSDGSLIESGATGSALFRSIRNGKVYWIGNLCGAGDRARGNWPRTPLVVARVCERPFSLERDSITVIDQSRSGEDQYVQHSNFRMYQDRQTGEAVLYLTRYGERGTPHDAWLKADQYEYRVALP